MALAVKQNFQVFLFFKGEGLLFNVARFRLRWRYDATRRRQRLCRDRQDADSRKGEGMRDDFVSTPLRARLQHGTRCAGSIKEWRS